MNRRELLVAVALAVAAALIVELWLKPKGPHGTIEINIKYKSGAEQH